MFRRHCARVRFKSNEFFFLTLKSDDVDAKRRMMEGMTNSIKRIIDDVSRLSWMSNGSLAYHDAFLLTPVEREILKESYSEMIINTRTPSIF